MCVIAVKPNNVDLPSDDKLKAMWDKNSDGAGYMYALNGDVVIEKGFMVYEDLKRALEELQGKLTALNLTLKDLPMVLHFRITTHGGTSPANTHPFPLSDNVDHLKALDVKCKLGMAHNGVISSVDKETDISDTMVFIRDIMFPLSLLTSDFAKKYEKLVKATIGWSRLAFLRGDGDITLIGDFLESSDKDGLKYSNLNHEPKKYDVSYRSYSNHKQRSYYEDWDEIEDYYGKTCDDTCEPSNFKRGNKYKLKSNKIGFSKETKEAIYVYIDEGKINAYQVSSYGRFTVLGDTTNTVYWRHLDDMEPYEEEKPKKNSNNIGGRKNLETAKLEQNANRLLYVKENLPKVRLIKVPKGTVITNYENLSKHDPSKALINNKYKMVVSSDNVYYYPDISAYIYRQSDGCFMEISKLDTTFEYLYDEETGRIEDYKSSTLIYANLSHHTLVKLKNITLYRIPKYSKHVS